MKKLSKMESNNAATSSVKLFNKWNFFDLVSGEFNFLLVLTEVGETEK